MLRFLLSQFIHLHLKLCLHLKPVGFLKLLVMTEPQIGINIPLFNQNRDGFILKLLRAEQYIKNHAETEKFDTEKFGRQKSLQHSHL